MPIVLEESGLRFEFDDSWSVETYDKLPYYDKIKKCFAGRRFGPKGVDFLALDGNGRLFFIEVTNYVGYSPKPLRSGSTGGEFAEKVFCTIPALFGRARAGSRVFDWESAARSFWSNDFHCLLFAVESELRNKGAGRSAAQRDLQRRLAWLTRDVRLIDLNDYQKVLPKVQATRIA